MTVTAITVSGVSASGKSTIVEAAKSLPGVNFIEPASVTTREPRPGDVPGAYRHVTAMEFKHLIDRGEMVEFDFVNDHIYGVAKADMDRAIETARATGGTVLAILTPPGAFAAKEYLQERDVAVSAAFIETEPDMALIRLVTRFTHDVRALREAGGTEEQERALADAYQDRINATRPPEPGSVLANSGRPDAKVEATWTRYEWDYRIDNAEGSKIEDLAHELVAMAQTPPAPTRERAVAQQQVYAAPGF